MTEPVVVHRVCWLYFYISFRPYKFFEVKTAHWVKPHRQFGQNYFEIQIIQPKTQTIQLLIIQPFSK